MTDVLDVRIDHRDNGHRGIFYLAGDGDGELLAEMTYHHHPTGNTPLIVIEHTGVRETLRGQGVARKLVEAGVDFARDNGLLIAPVCPYARRVLTNDEQYADVVAEGWRTIVFHGV